MSDDDVTGIDEARSTDPLARSDGSQATGTMEVFWRRTGVSLGKYWKIVAAVVLVLTALFAVGLTNLEFATGQDSYLNPSSQVAEDNVIFQDAFGGETVILLFSATGDAEVQDLFTGENLATLERITDELRTVDEAYSVVTPLVSLEFADNLIAGGAGTGALTAAATRDEAFAAERGEDINIALARLQAVPADQRVIGDPGWNEVLIYGNDGYQDNEDGLAAPAPDERAIRLSLASTFPERADGTRFKTAVGGVVLTGNATLDEQTAGTEKVLDILDGVEFQGFDLTVTGSPVYLAEINDYLKGGMLSLGLAAFVVMIVVLALLFRVRWRLLPLLSVLVGVIWAFSLLGLIGIDLSLVTIAGLPILIGLGIDFAIQIHNRVEEEVVLDRSAHPIAETVANLAPPLIVATITGVLAFLSLQISKVPMIRDFGILLALGVVVLVIVGIVVPASALGIREWKKPTTERGPSMVERAVVWLGGLPTKAGPILIALAVAVFVGGVLTEGQAKIESDPIKWIDQDSEVVQDIERLEAETGFSSTLGVLVQTNNIYDQDVVDLLWGFTLDAEQLTDEDGEPVVVSTSSLVNTMGKIIDVVPGEEPPIAPASGDIIAADEAMPADVANALVGEDPSDPPTQTQLNLRLAPSSLEERADYVDQLQERLDERIADLDLDPDSVLLVDLPADQDPVRATPAGLATVGIGLLDNLSANRANLTYLALCLAAIYLILRLRSFSRTLLALVPVGLAVGLSSMVVGLVGLTLSPLTTVSGPLVIATCAEFSVLILSRYLEERQRSLEPRAASDKAAARTGRAFFTSAVTTIGGFAVLIGSALPLLRDFGVIVTLNVAIALLAALVVMPPLSVWVDQRGWLGTQEHEAPEAAAVHIAAKFPGRQTIGMVIGLVLAVGGAVIVYATADTDDGDAVQASYAAVPLPTTTTTTTTTTTLPPTTTVEGQEPPPEEPAGPAIDPSGFPAERPTDPIQGVLFDLLADQGVEGNVANCAISTLFTRISAEELLALVGPPLADEAVALVTQSSLDCGIDQESIDAAITQFNGG